MKIRLIESIEELISYEETWKTLYTNQVNIFTSWEFCNAWMSVFGNIESKPQKILLEEKTKLCYFHNLSYSLHVLVCEDPPRNIVLIAPFVIKDIGEKVLTFLGDDDFDYHGFVYIQYTQEVVRSVADYLLEFIRNTGGVVDLKGIRSDDRFSHDLMEYLTGNDVKHPKEVIVESRYYATCPLLNLHTYRDINCYRKGLHKTLARLLRKCEKYKSEKGYHWLYETDVSTIMGKFDTIVQMSKEYWQKRDSYSLFSIKENIALVKGLIESCSNSNIHCIAFQLSDNASVLGYVLTFRVQDVLYYYLPVRTDQSEFNVGTFLIDKIIQYALSEGINTLDFLRGTRAYKYQWGAIDSLVTRIYMHGTTQANEEYILNYPFGDIVPSVDDPDGAWEDILTYPDV